MSVSPCPACGSAVSDETATLCGNCGAQLAPDSDPNIVLGPLERHVPRSPSMVTRPPSASASGSCAQCGTALTADASVCPACGSAVTAQTPPDPDA